MSFNIADLFEHAVDAVPDRTALVIAGDEASGVAEDEVRTFAQLDEAANRFAHHLLAQGLGPGDHVGIYGTNSGEWVEAMLGTFKIGAVPINVNYRYVEGELRYLLDDAQLVALVFDSNLAPRVAAVRDDLARLGHLVHISNKADGTAGDGRLEALEKLGSIAYDQAVGAASPERGFDERSEDAHYVLYTGGTTGMPKGVIWRHEDVFMALGGGLDIYTNEPVASDTELAEKAKQNESPLVSLCLPPMMHGAAQWSVMRFLFDGSTTVLVRRFDPAEAWRIIDRWKVNSMTMTGDAMARPLIETLEEMDAAGAAPELSSLFVVASSAVVFSPALKDRFFARFPDVMIVDAIGSSETGANGIALVQPGATKMDGGPTVRPGSEAVVLDEDLRELPPGTGQVGQLARTGHIPLGYHRDEEKTRATFVTGPDGRRFVLAGDMARVEADGSVTLLGRGSVCINTGGEKVYPEEVEGVVKDHAAVYDALVVGVEDERWGQQVSAVVQLRDGHDLTLEELDGHCRQHLAGYKVPRRLTLVDQVVRAPSGKPDYPWAKKVATKGVPTGG
jgi:3-oxocholest-4-en-26-oate---CoA ligase